MTELIYDKKRKRYFIDERHRWLVIKQEAGSIPRLELGELSTYEVALARAQDD